MGLKAEEHDQPILTVSQISSILDNTIRNGLGKVSIRGEISNLKASSIGHIYFSLKDSKAVINAICWKSSQPSSIKIADGMEVVCTGNITIYPERSNYQIIVQKLEIYGVGALLALLEKRKKQLAAEGLFADEHKKPLPLLPRIIAIITSLEGAVVRDIMHRIRDRFPIHVLLWGVPVQGQMAAEKVAEAIRGINLLGTDSEVIGLNAEAYVPKPDLIIIARGGGSIEDLWPFNEEILARAVFASAIPIISAIGHEIDYTILDMVADVRAPTPTAAAEIALPKRHDLAIRIQKAWQRIDNIMLLRLQSAINNLSVLEAKISNSQQNYTKIFQYIENIPTLLKHNLHRILVNKELLLSKVQLTSNCLQNSLYQKQLLLDDYGRRLFSCVDRLLQDRADKLSNTLGLLKSYSHKNVLKRGFALVRQNEALLTSSDSVVIGSHMEIELYDGIVRAVAIGGEGDGVQSRGYDVQGREQGGGAAKTDTQSSDGKVVKKQPAPRSVPQSKNQLDLFDKK